MRSMNAVLILAAVALTACEKKPEVVQTPAADSTATMNTPPAPSAGPAMMSQMRAHLDSVGAMDAAQMAAAMPAHEAFAARMLDAMGADMQGRSMMADSAWTALSDSLRTDLTDMPGLSGTALKTRMEGHIGRMQRIMTMNHGMMTNMQM